MRAPQGSRHQPLWRLHPERWLESLVVRDVSAIDERLDHACLYSQVPAFSASDRSMLDVLTTTRERRLAVVELKADEDIHLPLQGLDYWARWSGISREASSSSSGIFREWSCQGRARCCSWWRRRCIFIRRQIRCFDIWRPRSSGRWWGLMNVGAMGYA